MYEFYIGEYRGTKIPSVTDFKGVLTEATAYVDGYVLNRDNLAYRQIEERYNCAICAVAEVIYEQSTAAAQKQSETVGNHSVTYRVKSANEYTAEKRSKVMTYLGGTGLMYSVLR